MDRLDARRAATSGTDRKRRRHVERRLQDLSLSAVYWLMFVGMLIATLAVSLFVMNLLFRFHIFKAPGSVLLLGTFVVTAVIIGAFFARMFVRSITRPILEMSDAAERMAEGDFNIELHEKTIAAEVSQMAESFTAMARELSETEMLRSDFVSNVSHEMKTPVATIKGYASLLEDPALPPADRALYIKKILYAAERLSSLTDNALLLSQLEHADIQLDRAPFALDEQLREAILMYGPQWEQGERELDVELEEDVLYCGNEGLLIHVWQNLVGNALKFTKAGDIISVRLFRQRRAQGGDPAVAGVTVVVSDTGIGMEKDASTRIFEKFYQADRSHATEGNGLGLPLAQRIVELHGGSISVESAPGAGSTFTVWLPQAP